MLDFSKLGDLSKMASQAKEIQAKQEQSQRVQTELLQKISNQLQEVIDFLRKVN